jgi:hypothetical protein
VCIYVINLICFIPHIQRLNELIAPHKEDANDSRKKRKQTENTDSVKQKSPIAVRVDLGSSTEPDTVDFQPNFLLIFYFNI